MVIWTSCCENGPQAGTGRHSISRMAHPKKTIKNTKKVVDKDEDMRYN